MADSGRARFTRSPRRAPPTAAQPAEEAELTMVLANLSMLPRPSAGSLSLADL